MNKKQQIIFDQKIYDSNGNNKISTFLCYIIDKCNKNCRYCYNDFPRTNLILDLNILENFVYKYKQLYNTNIQLLLFGGEPTLHNDLFNFCINMQKLNVKCNIISNFSQSIDYYLNFLKLNNVSFDFSWHSTYNDKIDFIQKIKLIPFNFFENKKIDIIIMYEQEEIDKSLNLYIDFDDIYKKYIDFTFVNRRPYNSNLIYQYNYTPEQIDKYNNIIKKYKSIRLEFDNLVFIYNNQVEKISTIDFSNPYKKISNFKFWLCNAGKDQLYIHFNGDISSCSEMYFQKKLKIGNIYEKIDLKKLKYTICRVDNCACSFYSKKQKIF